MRGLQSGGRLIGKLPHVLLSEKGFFVTCLTRSVEVLSHDARLSN